MNIFFDNNSTTIIDSDTLNVFTESLLTYKNPSSTHTPGQQTKAALVESKRKLSKIFTCDNRDLLFTSGSTESINLIIHLLTRTLKSGVITYLTTDHSAVTQTVNQPIIGWKSYAITPSCSSVFTKDLFKKIPENTKILITSAANSELGHVISLDDIADWCHEKGIALILDTTSWIGKLPFIYREGITAFCGSAHKFHGPPGVGFCFDSTNAAFVC